MTTIQTDVMIQVGTKVPLDVFQEILAVADEQGFRHESSDNPNKSETIRYLVELGLETHKRQKPDV